MLQWSKDLVRGALLVGKPQKPVSNFKFNGSGKSEIVRNIQVGGAVIASASLA